MIDLFCIVVPYMVIIEIWNRREGINLSINHVCGCYRQSDGR